MFPFLGFNIATSQMALSTNSSSIMSCCGCKLLWWCYVIVIWWDDNEHALVNHQESMAGWLSHQAWQGNWRVWKWNPEIVAEHKDPLSQIFSLCQQTYYNFGSSYHDQHPLCFDPEPLFGSLLERTLTKGPCQNIIYNDFHFGESKNTYIFILENPEKKNAEIYSKYISSFWKCLCILNI